MTTAVKKTATKKPAAKKVAKKVMTKPESAFVKYLKGGVSPAALMI